MPTPLTPTLTAVCLSAAILTLSPPASNADDCITPTVECLAAQLMKMQRQMGALQRTLEEQQEELQAQQHKLQAQQKRLQAIEYAHPYPQQAGIPKDRRQALERSHPLPKQEVVIDAIEHIKGDIKLEQVTADNVKVVGTDKQPAKLEVNGQVTANTFEGQDAKLTHLVADNVKVVGTDKQPAKLEVKGQVTANTFEGHDAKLTHLVADNVKVVGTDKQPAKLEVNGQVTANTFEGHDAKLTHLVADNVKVVGTDKQPAKLEVKGQVTANTFEGDGAKLTNLNANNLSHGTLNAARIPNLSANKITTGQFTAKANLKLNGHWLSGDGDNEGVYVANNGNVGIGTTTPGAKLDVSGNLKITGSANGVIFSDSRKQTRSPRVIYTPDTRSGCPPSASANTDLWKQTFTLANTASIATFANAISAYGGRMDIILYVDGHAKNHALTDSASVNWQDLHLHWGGTLSAGTHTISVRSSATSAVGCGRAWGDIMTLIFE
ncbi:MAG: hypothetical protein DRR08_00920 [Candidatus Parabeggiatoa sp. nov. 2]|nr:MAG: hypothetical protein DRR08_00920 [Gammaproteobacteria bacterium]